MITLETLTIEGFRAYKNEAVFAPGGVAGLKLITGDNKTNKRLGANGAGKSSLWDALVWCLYGTSSRGLRSSDLTSWGAKGISVVAEFSKGDRITRIARTSKPPRLYIDETPVEQVEVDRYMGLSKVRFLHSVLFGQAARLFPDLSLPERASLFDDIMDLSVWQKATQKALDRHAALTDALADFKSQIGRIEAKLEAVSGDFFDKLEEAAEEWESRRQEELEAARNAYRREARLLREAQEHLDSIPENTAIRKELNQISSELAALGVVRDADRLGLARANDARSAAKETIKFYQDTNECPTCRQTISNAFSAEEVAKAVAARDLAGATVSKLSYDIVGTEREIERLRQEREALLKKQTRSTERSRAAADRVYEQERRVTRAEKVYQEVEQAAEDGNPHQRQLVELKKQRKTLKHEKEHLVEEVGVVEKQIANLDYWRTGFKKVRLFILKRTLDMLEIDVGNAIESLGLRGWQVKFATETDNKSGGVKTGIQIVVTSPTSSAVWEAWSGGEGQRLRVAIAVGFANLIQRLGGVNFGFEVWDEPSSWLSTEGVEDLLSTLAHRAQQTGKSVWVLDHRALQSSAFAEVWLVKKNRTGSTVRRLQ